MKVAITGASGFVASHLIKTFTDFVSIDRNDTEDDILEKLKGVDVVFNLAGAPILKKWTKSYKKILISSRINTTKTLVNAINKSDVKQLISTSAIGAYPDGARYDESFSDFSDDFLGSLTQMWEAEALKCTKPTTIIRFGVILGSDGGALAQMLRPFKMCVGGTIGNGKMMTSWIDVDDLVRIYSHVIENRLTGVFNATAPEPVTNYIFTKTLGKILHRPTLLPLPKLVLKVLFGQGATVLTASKEVYPKAIIDSGFTFKYPSIETSLTHLLG